MSKQINTQSEVKLEKREELFWVLHLKSGVEKPRAIRSFANFIYDFNLIFIILCKDY